MFRNKLIAATLASLIALGAAGAASASSGENENAKEVSAVLNAKTTISQAIAVAETQTGGRAMKVDVEHKKDNYLYEIKIVSKDTVSDVTVDPASGKITRTDDEGLIAKVFDREDREEFAKLASSPVTLTAAIATAEKEVDGKAIEAKFENEDDKPLFEVEVAKGKAMHKVMVDAASGNVIKVSATEHGDHKED